VSSQGKICVADARADVASAIPTFAPFTLAQFTLRWRQPRYPCRLVSTTEDRRLCVAIFRWLCPCSTLEILRAPVHATYRTSPHRRKADGGKETEADWQAMYEDNADGATPTQTDLVAGPVGRGGCFASGRTPTRREGRLHRRVRGSYPMRSISPADSFSLLDDEVVSTDA